MAKMKPGGFIVFLLICSLLPKIANGQSTCRTRDGSASPSSFTAWTSTTIITSVITGEAPVTQTVTAHLRKGGLKRELVVPFTRHDGNNEPIFETTFTFKSGEHETAQEFSQNNDNNDNSFTWTDTDARDTYTTQYALDLQHRAVSPTELPFCDEEDAITATAWVTIPCTPTVTVYTTVWDDQEVTTTMQDSAGQATPTPVVLPPPSSSVMPVVQASPAQPASITNCITTPMPWQAGMVTNCNKFYSVPLGMGCDRIAQQFGIAVDDIVHWNPGAQAGCTMLAADNYACVGTTTCITTPTPIQTGMAENCDNFYQVPTGEGCDKLAAKFGISVDDIIKWNPDAKPGCTNLLAQYYACVHTTDCVWHCPGAAGPAPATAAPAIDGASAASTAQNSQGIFAPQQPSTLANPVIGVDSAPPVATSVGVGASMTPPTSLSSIGSVQWTSVGSTVATESGVSSSGDNTIIIGSRTIIIPKISWSATSGTQSSAESAGATNPSSPPFSSVASPPAGVGIDTSMAASSNTATGIIVPPPVSMTGGSSGPSGLTPPAGGTSSTPSLSTPWPSSQSTSDNLPPVIILPTGSNTVPSGSNGASSAITTDSNTTPVGIIMGSGTNTGTTVPPVGSGTNTGTTVPPGVSGTNTGTTVPPGKSNTGASNTGNTNTGGTNTGDTNTGTTNPTSPGSTDSGTNSSPPSSNTGTISSPQAVSSPTGTSSSSSTSSDGPPPIVWPPPTPDNRSKPPCLPCPPGPWLVKIWCEAAVHLVGREVCDFNINIDIHAFGIHFPHVFPIVPIIPDPFHPPNLGKPGPPGTNGQQNPPPGGNGNGGDNPTANPSATPTSTPSCTDQTAALTSVGCLITGSQTTCSPYGTQTFTGCAASNTVVTYTCKIQTVTDKVVLCADGHDPCTTTSAVSEATVDGCEIMPTTLTTFSSTCTEKTALRTTISCSSQSGLSSCTQVGTQQTVGCDATPTVITNYCSVTSVPQVTVFCASQPLSGSCSSTSTISSTMISGCDVTATTTTTYAPACPAMITDGPDDDGPNTGNETDEDHYIPPLAPAPPNLCDPKNGSTLDLAQSKAEYIFYDFCQHAGAGMLIDTEDGVRKVWESMYTYDNTTNPPKVLELTVATDPDHVGMQMNATWCFETFRFQAQNCQDLNGLPKGITTGGCLRVVNEPAVGQLGLCINLYDFVSGTQPPIFSGPTTISLPASPVPTIPGYSSSRSSQTSKSTTPAPPPPSSTSSSPAPTSSAVVNHIGWRPPNNNDVFYLHVFDKSNVKGGTGGRGGWMLVSSDDPRQPDAPLDCDWMVKHHYDFIWEQNTKKALWPRPNNDEHLEECKSKLGLWQDVPALESLRWPYWCGQDGLDPEVIQNITTHEDCVLFSKQKDEEVTVWQNNTGLYDGMYLQCKESGTCCRWYGPHDWSKPNRVEIDCTKHAQDVLGSKEHITLWRYKPYVRCHSSYCNTPYQNYPEGDDPKPNQGCRPWDCPDPASVNGGKPSGA